MMRGWFLTLAAVALVPACASQEARVSSGREAESGGSKLDLRLPNKPESVKFLVIGDSGTGEREQYEIGRLAAAYKAAFPFEFAIMLGDNMYGKERPKDFEDKFERPYKALLDQGVKFYASLGNHDTPNQVHYKLFNMGGERYYTFKPKDGVRFFALDTTYLGPEQLKWVDEKLAGSGSEWKIAFFHHPLYSSGDKHGPSLDLRNALEPLFVKHGISVVFAGHEHFYERIHPQKGIHYFIEGASGKLRRGNIERNPQTAKGYDQDQSFMLVEIDGDQMYFQAISRRGLVVDSGMIRRPGADASQVSEAKPAAAAASTH